MSHRVEQILDALVALMPTTAAAVYKHRAMTLSDEAGELPAISINLGADTPLDDDGASNFAFIDSLAAIEIIVRLQDSDEQTALSKLLDFRRDIHVAVMADRELGLSSFVIDTRYAGAEAPERDVEQALVAGRLVTRWLVHYRMNIGDPA